MNRIYVCHTYYHVLISTLKELNREDGDIGSATMVLSLMSTDFENLKDRLLASKIYKDVILFDEKRDEYFPEVMALKQDKGNIILNLFERIQYTKTFSKALEPFVPVDFKNYSDIYVFCDADPIGIYLNKHKIHYHALEDGLDTLRTCVQAKFDNRGAWPLKKFFSEKLNLIFICDGYSKYCLDMEVNNIACIDDNYKKYKEVPRSQLFDSLDEKGRETILKIFVKDYDLLKKTTEKCKNEKSILILTEPLCTLDVRKQIFTDIIETYSKEGMVIFKPHPRDELDYKELFPDIWSFDKTVPMEMLRFMDVRFSKVVSVYTELANINFADEAVFLGDDFMDKYEDPRIHRKAEIINGTLDAGE